ncbi:3610_t:CDS:2 [Acaulospora colombiana]|uniref:3610_t:CDS:1 n=1 Tax=Acaulospora colombiana TaxID=27376 RepID=A0ACA9K163_9GLOM|nr:3610_t:CDS:2 [Acaulospora colombiana]
MPFGIILLLLIISEAVCFTPYARVGQTQALVGTKLFYAGGYTGLTQAYSNELFYLNLSSSFQASNPPWVSLTNANIPISPTYSTFVVSPFDNFTIYLIGGYLVNPSTNTPDNNTLIYAFNSNVTEWTMPTISGSSPKRQEMEGVVDNTGKVYIFGGSVITNYTTRKGIFFNDMNILDMGTNIWSTIQPTSNFPNPRIDYTAILLDNNIIVYIGGREYANDINQTEILVDLHQIQLFDTKNSNWSSMTATGVNLQARRFHTAVLAKNGQIIIYGGENINFTPVTPNLAILNTSVTPYNWYIPTINAGPYDPPLLAEHSATMYEDLMIIAFGIFYEL